MSLDQLRAKAVEARDWKQCIGAIRGCPHCCFEVSPNEVIALIDRIAHLEAEVKRLGGEAR